MRILQKQSARGIRRVNTTARFWCLGSDETRNDRSKCLKTGPSRHYEDSFLIRDGFKRLPFPHIKPASGSLRGQSDEVLV